MKWRAFLLLSFGALLGFPSSSRSEIPWAEKPGERQIQPRERAVQTPKGLKINAQDSGKSKRPSSIFFLLVEAYAGAEEGIANLFRFRLPGPAPQENQQLSKLTNHPVSSLAPVLKNLQAVGGD